MNSTTVCDFNLEVKRARHLTKDQLQHAILDCQECIWLGINPDKYYDQISVYRAELARRA